MIDINEEEKDMRLIVKIRDLPIVEENKLTMSEKSWMNNNLILNSTQKNFKFQLFLKILIYLLKLLKIEKKVYLKSNLYLVIKI